MYRRILSCYLSSSEHLLVVYTSYRASGQPEWLQKLWRPACHSMYGRKISCRSVILLYYSANNTNKSDAMIEKKDKVLLCKVTCPFTTSSVLTGVVAWDWAVLVLVCTWSDGPCWELVVGGTEATVLPSVEGSGLSSEKGGWGGGAEAIQL